MGLLTPQNWLRLTYVIRFSRPQYLPPHPSCAVLLWRHAERGCGAVWAMAAAGRGQARARDWVAVGADP
eukprot:COSAG01_NODE_470_length_16575_cov_5.572408_10_plen_69_part_00